MTLYQLSFGRPGTYRRAGWGERRRMGTVLNYLRRYGDIPFREKPMTEVDSLALCQLAYLKFDGMVPAPGDGHAPVALKSLEHHPDFEKLFGDTRYEKVNRALIRAMVSGRRFGEIRLHGYVNVVDKQWETQFSAVTFFLDDDTVYVAYRGTDETIVGWKEDFNMAFLTPVPAQEYSVNYLNETAFATDRPLYVGGHSKGGNLAVYSAMKCQKSIQDRIVKIYSMDGPGFRPEVVESGEYAAVADRVVKILPHSSLVGMLFESDMRFQVVESKTFGLAQHDPYTWLVEQDHLVRVKGIHERCLLRDNTLNRWILSLDEKQLRLFVDTLYQVIEASQADSLIELTAEWKRSMNGILSAMKEVDEETMKMLKEIIKGLFEVAGEQMRQEVTKGVPEGLGKREKPGKQARTKLSPRRS